MLMNIDSPARNFGWRTTLRRNWMFVRSVRYASAAGERGSLSVTSACNGVFVGVRRAVQRSRAGMSKLRNAGYAAERFQNV